ncbi:ComEC/Rec2 family competence protein [Marinomonas sp. IMCC 4694]|uniref:ComEC/Rec2 family competence protein n=1 Tax=Marinomonas sp. IMCC 4694 TaxID=2605432 RepID=UPI0011E6F9A3|nr:ComEC/Rec2 family competence protein [Marinomonas sp. IMCC 4694]TYL47761.1 ComEC/Rec2 family competence protein [Marinomonas sp. IMCC 4694]
MLLSSLSILMGAILVPSDYFWVYSTHIIITCLYLIRTKRFIVCFLTVITLIVVCLHEYRTDKVILLSSGQEVWVDFEQKRLIYTASTESDLKEAATKTSVTLTFFLADGLRYTLENFSLSPINSSLSPTLISFASPDVTPRVPPHYKATIKGILLPDKNGPWWQRYLYVKRQSAQLSIEFYEQQITENTLQDRNIRRKLLISLDQAFNSFSSWRFSKALILGNNDLWSERDTWIVRTLGLAHLFVVSGLHTGFMFVIGRFISRMVWQWLPNKLILSGLTRWHCDAVIVIPLLFLYAYFTAWGEPVVRASIMLSVYLCARMLALKMSPWGIISFALWVVLLYEPRSVMSPGLWLSFSMVYLLIGYCQTSTSVFRLILLQVMLSTASMVLILGWQEAVSSASILMNVLLIPFAAFVWFPWGVIACVEGGVFASHLAYEGLDWVLYYVVRLIEWVAFQWPLLHFESFHSTSSRWLMLVLMVFWVYQSPLKRGLVCAMLIWWLIFSSTFLMLLEPVLSAVWLGTETRHFTVANNQNTLSLNDEVGVLLSNQWVDSDLTQLTLNSQLGLHLPTHYLMAPRRISELTAQDLIVLNASWVIMARDESTKTLAMLEALKVNWLIIPEGQTLDFFVYNRNVSLRHSSCLYSFFLFKSDTCKRVEKLESMLN